jgi:serine/threonine-protein kinase
MSPPGSEHLHPATVGDWPALEGLIKRFEEAWHRGLRPAIDDYLPGDAEMRQVLLVELVHTELEFRLKSEEAARVEEYLARYPELAGDSTAVVGLLAAEFAFRKRVEPDARLDEYRERFPHFGAAVAEQVARATIVDSGAATMTLRGPARQYRAALPEVAGYELLGELGRGGMGVVYKAREVRLNRVVALKMILAGDHAAPDAAARFRVEAEAVARLHHPQIVQIYAFGDQDGRPYFAMEYVAGGSLTDRLDGSPWIIRDAARLVEMLARAVHEAHRLGIVHRDLKPANVLMTAGGMPKLADFGLAKWLDVGSGLTRTEHVLGTPSYMAPEQAEGATRTVGPAADVYSLGTILYELLTGRPPFRAATALETLEQVKSAEPVSPARLRPDCPRDLVTICLKCLEKQPARRYTSAAELGDDLARFEAGDPIRARPVGGLERLWRWCRREPAVATLAVALLAGLAGVATQWWRAEVNLKEALHERGRAEEHARRQVETNRALRLANEREHTARRRAQERFDAAMKALARFEEISKDAVLLREPRLGGPRARLLRTALDFYRELQASLEEDASPEARSQLADAYARVAVVTSELGLQAEALAAYQRSLALVERMAAAAPGDPAVRASLGTAHSRLGFTFRKMGRPGEALMAYERARAIQEPLAREHPANTRYQEVLSWSFSNLGVIQLELRHTAEAILLHRRAIGIHEGIVDRAPGNPRYRSDLAWCWRYLSLGLAAAGDLDAALRQAEQAATLHAELLRTDRHDVEFRWRRARCLDEIGRIRTLSGRPAEAAEPLEQAATAYEELARENPVLYAVDRARNRLYLASQRALSGRPEEATGFLRRAREMLDQSSPVRPELVLYDIACASSLWSVAGQDGAIAPSEREARGERAIAALRRAVADGYRDPEQMRRDPVLDPLRPRRDFRELMREVAFPDDPFQP